MLEYKRNDEKPEKIQKIIDCFEITKYFKYTDVTIEERKGDAEIIFSKLEFEYPFNSKPKIYFTINCKRSSLLQWRGEICK